MKTILRSAFVLAAFSVAPLFAETFSLEDYAFSVRNSANVDFAGTSSLTGSFGVFSAGFTPDSTNLSTWSSNFNAPSGSVSYIDASSPEWNVGFQHQSNAGVFTSGTQLSLWVYNNTQTASAAAQWALLTDSSWRLTTYDQLSLPVGLNFTVNTVALYGNYDFANSFIQTATAVPEPATYAAVLGLVTLGLVSYRRFRRR